MSESIGRLCTAAGLAFPDAVRELRYYLTSIPYPAYLVRRLHEARSCERFPEQATDFLDRIIGDETRWIPEELDQCLRDIASANVQVAQEDPSFLRLRSLEVGRVR